METYLEGDVWVSVSQETVEKFLDSLDRPGVDLSAWSGGGEPDPERVRRILTVSGDPVRTFLEAYGFEFTGSELDEDDVETLEFSWAGMWRYQEKLLDSLIKCGAAVEGEVFDPDADDPDEPVHSW